MSSLRNKLISGTIWTVVAYGSSQVLRFGGNLLLTRLLAPEIFGLLALVNILIMGLELFSDVGIIPSIVQNQRGEDVIFLNTAWTLQILRGFGLWMGCLLITWPAAQFYQDSKLFWLVPVMGLSTIIQGFNSTAIPLLSRRIEIDKLLRLELSIQVLSLSIMIVWAYLKPTAWALVGGYLIGSLVKMFWTHQLNSDTPNRLAWDRECLKEIMTLGRWIFVSTALTFLATQSDRLILGKFFSLEMLGVYTIAISLAELPKQIIIQINGRVVYPVIARQNALPRQELREKILRKRWWLLLGSALLIIALCSCGDLLIFFLYDRRYEEAAWMLPILALGLWPCVLAQTGDKTLVAIGKPYYSALANFFKVLFNLIGLPLGFFTMGIVGVIGVIACNDFPFYGGVVYGLHQEKLSAFWQDIQATAVFVILLGLTIFIRVMLGLKLPIPA